jgi:transposase
MSTQSLSPSITPNFLEKAYKYMERKQISPDNADYNATIEAIVRKKLFPQRERTEEEIELSISQLRDHIDEHFERRERLLTETPLFPNLQEQEAPLSLYATAPPEEIVEQAVREELETRFLGRTHISRQNPQYTASVPGDSFATEPGEPEEPTTTPVSVQRSDYFTKE